MILLHGMTSMKVSLMFEEPVYEGRLCSIRRVGELLRVEPAMGALLYSHDELLVETQMILAALLGDKG